MISVGNRDANNGLGLGLGLAGVGGGLGGREMEETELEEGEACSYNNDNAGAIDPDVALSYLDEKLQDVLGHFQKDFEGGVSAENLGSKFGGYGSFLPTYQRSPAWSQPKTPPILQNHNVPRSPNNMQSEGARRNSSLSSTAPQSLRPAPVSKAPTNSDLDKEDVLLPSTRAEEYASRHVPANKKKLTDHRPLKVRIKVGSDNLATKKNAAIYSGLGLDVSPSSSPDDSPSESEGMDREPEDGQIESPTYVLKVMTSFPVPEKLLLSPISDYINRLIEKDKLLRDGRSGVEKTRGYVNNESDVGKVVREKKSKAMEKHELSLENRSGNNRDALISFSALRKEDDVDNLACEELVTETLKLPLLSSAYLNADNSTKSANRVADTSKDVSKGAMRDTICRVSKEESVEPISAQDINWDDNQKTGMSGKVWEDKMARSVDDLSVYPKKDNYKKEKILESVGADSSLMVKKHLKTEPIDLPKQKSKQRVTPHDLDGTKIVSRKEHQSSNGKKKSMVSQNHVSEAAEVLKDNLRIDSTSVHKIKKDNYADVCSIKRETEEKKQVGKSEDAYREFFGDLGEPEEESKMGMLDMHSETKLKDPEMVENKSSAIINASSCKKPEKFSTPEVCPKPVPNPPPAGEIPICDATQVATAPLVIKENWVCCDKCQKWRLLPLGTNPESLPEKWLCSMITWLPGMNRCSISEDAYTKAFMALYHVPVSESQNNLHVNPPGVAPRSNLADVQHPDQNIDYSSRFPSHGGKKKHGLKETTSVTNKDGSIHLSNPMKKGIQVSARSGNMYDVSPSPVVSEPDFRQVSKTGEKHKHKHKEKHKVLDHMSDGGGIKSLKMKGKRESEQGSSKASKKLKTEGMNSADGYRTPDYGLALVKDGSNLSNGVPSTSIGKDRSRHSDHYFRDSKSDIKDRSQSSAKMLKDKVKVSCDDVAVKKRKMRDNHDIDPHPDMGISTGNCLQDTKNFMEEFSENDYRNEKKARVSKSERKESSLSRDSGKGDKKGAHGKNKHRGQDLGSTRSHQSMDGKEFKLDSGPVQPSVAATSSSSKVSGSHKNKASFHETKGSPVESVSSSPMRISNADKGTSARRNQSGKSESHEEFVAVGSPKRSSFREDDGGSDRSGTAGKEKVVAQHGSIESSVLDSKDKALSGDKAKAEVVSSPIVTEHHTTNDSADYLAQDSQHYRKPTSLEERHYEEREIENCNHANGSRPRKSGKGSSSRSKDKNCTPKTGSFSESHDNAPYEVKSKDGRNKFQDKYGIKSDDKERRHVEKKDSGGKLSSESSKRESQSSMGVHNGPDAKVNVICSQETITLPKLLECNGERSSKTPIFDGMDRTENVTGRGKSQPLPLPTGAQNEILDRCSRVVTGPHKGTESDSLAANASQANDGLKVPKHSRKPDHQNGSQQLSARHPSQNGHKIRDVDAPSPARKDSSSQAATSALKEAKDLKHLADRLKNNGSNRESTGLYFQAALKFLHGASLLESSSSENAKHGDIMQSRQIYSSTAKLCEFCAHEYEKSKDMAGASLAYKLMEVAYMRVIYTSHNTANRDRSELQTSLQMIPPGESPSSSASDVDNLNQPAAADKAAIPKGVNSPQVVGNHVIAARNRGNFVRLLGFAQDVHSAMEASRKSRAAFAASNVSLGDAQHRDGISSIKSALDFNFQDIDGLLRLVRLAMEAISR